MKEQKIKFKRKGKQREFLNLVVSRLNCVSVRGILQFGFDIPYSTLKNYYVERRLMEKVFFENLCHLAKINPDELDFEYLNKNWGQIKGGKKKR